MFDRHTLLSIEILLSILKQKTVVNINVKRMQLYHFPFHCFQGDCEGVSKEIQTQDPESWQQLAEAMTPSIVKVVEFAKGVPGFTEVGIDYCFVLHCYCLQHYVIETYLLYLLMENRKWYIPYLLYTAAINHVFARCNAIPFSGIPSCEEHGVASYL